MLYTKAHHCYTNPAFLLYSVPGSLHANGDFLGGFLLHVGGYGLANTRHCGKNSP